MGVARKGQQALRVRIILAVKMEYHREKWKLFPFAERLSALVGFVITVNV